jgi:hypothetical membrane protein
MTTLTTRSPRLLLWGAILLPVLYFGVQAALAPLFPGYSLLRDATSVLGSDRSPVAAWFNGVAILSGLCGLAGTAGLGASLNQDPAWLRWPIVAAVLVIALGCFWAGIFPLPHPLHPKNPSMIGVLALPPLLALGGWRAPSLRPLRPYLLLNLAGFLIMIPLMAGIVPLDRAALGGLLQRLLTLTVFPPIGVLGWSLLRRAG